jgi:two-component system response regulator HydG
MPIALSYRHETKVHYRRSFEEVVSRVFRSVSWKTSLMSVEGHRNTVVYVLDDDPSVLKSIGRLLVSEGFQCCTFHDPDIFLESVMINAIPVVILDVWMEGVTGLEVQSKLQRVSPRTRVIIMTGRTDGGVRQTAMKMGASAFLVKPFGDWELINAIEVALTAKS